jgi:hypothetical protein
MPPPPVGPGARRRPAQAAPPRGGHPPAQAPCAGGRHPHPRARGAARASRPRALSSCCATRTTRPARARSGAGAGEGHRVVREPADQGAGALPPPPGARSRSSGTRTSPSRSSTWPSRSTRDRSASCATSACWPTRRTTSIARRRRSARSSCSAGAGLGDLQGRGLLLPRRDQREAGRPGQGRADVRARHRERSFARAGAHEALGAEGVKVAARRAGARSSWGLPSGLIARLWLATLRVHVVVHPALEGVRIGPWVLAFWHGTQWPLLAWRRRRPTVVLVSLSRDGAMQARALALQGLRVVRGSSSRGGARGLAQVVRAMKRESRGRRRSPSTGRAGPRGSSRRPRSSRRARPGAVVVPLTGSMRRGLVLHRAPGIASPSRGPSPRVDVVLGEPIDPLGSTRLFSFDCQIARRPARARPIVMGSANSRSPPCGTPLAMRVAATPSGASSRLSSSAVASPSTLGRRRDDDLGDPVGADAFLTERRWAGRPARSLRAAKAACRGRSSGPRMTASTLDRHEIVHASDDAQGLAVALRIRTNVTEGRITAALGHVPAAFARAQFFAQAQKLRPEVTRKRLIGREQPQDVAMRSLFPDAGETGEEPHEPLRILGLTSWARIRSCRGSSRLRSPCRALLPFVCRLARCLG